MNALPVVRMFWHGSPLSLYERACVASFVAQGHAVEVYSYAPLDVPPGATCIDAREILPEDRVFAYRSGPGKGSFAGFSNLFRYRLLRDRGGIWSDFDVFCLRPFAGLPEAWVGRQDAHLVAPGLMGFPAGHPLVARLYELADAAGNDVRWGQTGPNLLTREIGGFPGVAVLPQTTFYPVHYSGTASLLLPSHRAECDELAGSSLALHWWNEILRRIGVPRDRLPPEGSWLGDRAASVLDGPVEHWSESSVRTWIDNHRAGNALGPALSWRDGEALPVDLAGRLGIRLCENGFPDAAVQLLSTACGIRPRFPPYRLWLGKATLASGDHAGAREHLKAALEFPDTSAEARRLLAGLDARVGTGAG